LRRYRSDDITDKLFALADTYPSYSDPISGILRKKIYGLLSQVQIGSSLDDREEHSTN
jgi:predicted oxidoreductase (fatty acid repression mutant protein)